MRTILLFALGLLACGDRPVKAPPRKAETQVDRAGVKPVGKDSIPLPAMPILRDVRLAGHPGYERIVFEFEGDLPKFNVEWATGPVSQCGSGEAVSLNSDTVLTVRFSSANAHTERGEVSGAPRDVAGQGRNIKQLKQICDFEGVVVWAVAVARRGAFEVHEVVNPARLAVDVHY